MEERVSREQQVAITVPAFWQVRDGEGQDSLLLADPVGGGVLRLRVEPVDPGEDLEKALEQAAQRRWLETVTPSPHSRARGALAPPSPLDLGGRPVYNFSYIVHVPLKGLEDREINAMVDIYVTSPEWPRFTRRSLGEGGASARGARLCWLEFQVPEASFKAYLPLIRKIVGSVRSTRLSDSGPGQWVLERGVIGKKGQTPILVRHGLVGA
jgi:hypothetical protein